MLYPNDWKKYLQNILKRLQFVFDFTVYLEEKALLQFFEIVNKF